MTDQVVAASGSGFLPDPIDLIRRFNGTHPAREQLYREAKQAGDELELCRQDLAVATVEELGARVAHESSLAKDPSRRAPLPRQVAIAVGAAAIDAFPCYLAAEAIGDDASTTLFVAGLFLICLIGGEAALDLFGRRGLRRGQRIAAWAMAGFVAALGLLRLHFLLTVSGGWLASALGALLLTSVTAAFVVVGFWALRAAESLDSYRARRALSVARRERAAAETAMSRGDKRLARSSRAYLSQIRTLLLEEAPNEAAADAMEQAVWAHLTHTVAGGGS